MSGLIGKKIGMTSIYNSEGKNEPCTIVLAGPCKVTQIKTKDKEGYEALQLGFSEKRKKHTTKPEVGHFAKTETVPPKKIAEFRYFKMSNYKLGDSITVDLFKEGELVDVTGVSKGKGFQGVVKRHGFAGVGQATHGQHNRLRAPGSIGAASYPARVFKGMKMAGRLGGERVTVQNLEILKVDKKNNLLVIKGCVPGHKNSYLIIQK